MNTVLASLKEDFNLKRTENNGVAYRSTLNNTYDLFAFGGSCRERSDEDCIFMFKKAFEEDKELALKCLFYLADCRGGQGERRFFRVCYNWLANNYPCIARNNLELIPIYRRWDDVIYSCVGTPIEIDALEFIKKQLILDLQCKTPSLLAKWLPSENASSETTKRMGSIVRSYLGMTHKEYRLVLSHLRSRINIVEKLMSENRWDEIKYDKIPSKAGLIYKNAFAKHDIEKKYEEFAKDQNTKVNADTLYPYEVVAKAINGINYWTDEITLSDTDRTMINKYWDSLLDYFDGKQSDILCVVDTSSSMTCRDGAAAPINVAISLGMYAAERAGGPFKDHYISFSSRPQLIKVEGNDFVDKVRRIYQTNLCENTNLTGVFDMLLDIADRPEVKEDDIPSTIVVISDMEINMMVTNDSWGRHTQTEMEKVRTKWENHGHKLPKLVYWCVNSRNTNTILDQGPGVSLVSGMSPVIFQQVITGKTGFDLMISTLENERYSAITV